MSVFLSPATIIPIHDVVQFASNARRSVFSSRDIRKDIHLAFSGVRQDFTWH
jgi:hypothetical protein